MTGPAQVSIRKGEATDAESVLELIQELATYERARGAVTLTLEQLREDGFGDDPIYGSFVAESAQNIVGIALYYEKYSTWTGRCLFLEDIIVTEAMRGLGIGKKLFEAVVAVAQNRNSARLEWQVLEWNRPAIDFYKRYGAELDGEWLNGKLTREQILAF